MSNEYVQRVADAIITQLQQGTAPWQKPWAPGERYLPHNPASGNTYHGINALYLMSLQQARGYGDSRWLTYKQTQAAGAQVRKGEKGASVQYWKWQGLEPVTDDNGKPVLDDNGEPKREMVRYQRPRVFFAVVFNADQIDGLSPPEPRPEHTWDRHAEAEKMLQASGADIRHVSGDRAYYRLNTDQITMPERDQFATADAYYATALHELGHWTGHPARLDRDLKHPFGSEGYAKEELRAEIASLMIGEQLELGHDPGQHVAYVASWIKVLQEDPREIFRAASDAERIVKFIHGLTQQQEQQGAQEHVRMPVLVDQQGPQMQTSDERTYLAVPYAEKNQAKALGARWDREQKSWYAPAGVDLAPLERWLPAKDSVHVEVTRDPREEFAEALRQAGLRLDGLPEMDGQLRRVVVEGDRGGERSGAYVGFTDGHPAGYIKNFRAGIDTSWKSQARAGSLGAEDRARLVAEAAQRRQERAKETEARYEWAAAEAEQRWSAAAEAPPDHPYLAAKGVPAYGIRQDADGNLLVPLRDVDGRLQTTQTLGPDGRKSFQKDGKVKGGHMMLGDPVQSEIILVAEGYATAAELHRATGLAVAAAMNAGNLAAVAEAYRERYPGKVIGIAADNDHQAEAAGRANVGREKAEAAAERVGGFVLLPRFEAGAKGSDWNDLAQNAGQTAARSQIEAGLAVGMRQVAARQIAAEQRAEKAAERGREKPAQQQAREPAMAR